MRIAITGGMGCGKSTVVDALASIFRSVDIFKEDYRFASYDSEILRMYRYDEDFRSRLREHFGTDSKQEVAALVFSDPEKMAWLIDETGPRMFSFMQKVTNEPNVVVEVPMLFEIGNLQHMFDITICVWCDEQTQRERIRARDKLSDDMIDRKLKMHLSNDEKAARSDYVIDTSDDAVDLFEQLETFLRVAKIDHS